MERSAKISLSIIVIRRASCCVVSDMPNNQLEDDGTEGVIDQIIDWLLEEHQKWNVHNCVLFIMPSKIWISQKQEQVNACESDDDDE